MIGITKYEEYTQEGIKESDKSEKITSFLSGSATVEDHTYQYTLHLLRLNKFRSSNSDGLKWSQKPISKNSFTIDSDKLNYQDLVDYAVTQYKLDSRDTFAMSVKQVNIKTHISGGIVINTSKRFHE